MINKFLSFEYDYSRLLYDYDYSGSYFELNGDDKFTSFVSVISNKSNNIGNIIFYIDENFSLKYEKRKEYFDVKKLQYIACEQMNDIDTIEDANLTTNITDIEIVELIYKNISLIYNLTDIKNYSKNTLNISIKQNFFNFKINDYIFKFDYNIKLNSSSGGDISLNFDLNKKLNEHSVYGFNTDYRIYLLSVSDESYNLKEINNESVLQIYYKNNKDNDYSAKIYYEFLSKYNNLVEILPERSSYLGAKISRY